MLIVTYTARVTRRFCHWYSSALSCVMVVVVVVVVVSQHPYVFAVANTRVGRGLTMTLPEQAYFLVLLLIGVVVFKHVRLGRSIIFSGPRVRSVRQTGWECKHRVKLPEYVLLVCSYLMSDFFKKIVYILSHFEEIISLFDNLLWNMIYLVFISTNKYCGINRWCFELCCFQVHNKKITKK